MRLFDRRQMAFTVESMTLRLLVFSGRKIESWYSVPLSSNLVREGLISSPEGVGSVMAEAIRENGIPNRGVVCAVSSTGSATQTITLPGVTKKNMKEMVGREIRRTMPSSVDADFVYWQELSPELSGEDAQKQQVYALAVPKNSITSLMEACRAAGVTVRGMELKPFALVRAVNCKSGVIVHGEVDNIEVVIVDKFFPGLFRSIPIKDANPTPDVASENLLRELPFTIDYYNRTYRDAQLDPEAVVYFSGELALDPKLAIEITEVTGREVVGVEPIEEYPPNFPMAQFLTNVGLMLREKW